MFKLIFLMSLHNINPLPFCSFFSQCSFETLFQISKAKKKKCFWTEMLKQSSAKTALFKNHLGNRKSNMEYHSGSNKKTQPPNNWSSTSVKEKSSEDVSSAAARGSQWHTPCLVSALTQHFQPTHFLSKLPLEKLDTMKTSVIP